MSWRETEWTDVVQNPGAFQGGREGVFPEALPKSLTCLPPKLAQVAKAQEEALRTLKVSRVSYIGFLMELCPLPQYSGDLYMSLGNLRCGHRGSLVSHLG